MERWKQVAKIFDNLGLGGLAATFASLLRDMVDQTDGRLHFKWPTGDAGYVLGLAIAAYVVAQLAAILTLWYVDESS
ncbi:hypothetical protein [Chromobacterium phragmitis]|uniref:Uncharacterized protein n=1 Tax=Chromobacterium phragmitis TaxID=2202141 RepID=A0ABV0J0M9_9NEIS